MCDYYKNYRLEEAGIRTAEDLLRYFKDGPDDLNTVLFSTSGVHGSYIKLNSLQVEFKANPNIEIQQLTVLIIRPRVVQMLWGEITVTRKDMLPLRKLIRASLLAIIDSQRGNLRSTFSEMNMLDKIAEVEKAGDRELEA